MCSKQRSLLASLVFCISIWSSNLFAQGNILVTPKRIVFDAAKRSDEINIVNTGKDTATYLISFVQYKMEMNGGVKIISVPDSGQYFADKNLRYFPRSVTLAPNVPQTIRIQVTKTNELAAGEYRSHLYFRAQPKNMTPVEQVKTEKPEGISINITPVFGISIPTIIRVGDNNTKVYLSNVDFKNENSAAPAIEMTIHREGNMSVYGDLVVEHLSTNGKATRVGSVNGLSVYTPNVLRNISVLLDKKAGVDYRSGSLKVSYSDPLTGLAAHKNIELK